MLTYQKSELMSSTEIVRNFSSILDSITTHEKEKIAIMRKNKLEAVIISIEEYERIHEILELFEHIHTFKTVKQREETPLSEYIDLDQFLAAQGISRDEI